MSGGTRSAQKPNKTKGKGPPPTALQVGVRRVPPEGISLELASSDGGPLAELMVRAYEGTEVDPGASSIRASLSLHAVGDDAVAVTGRLTGTLVLACDRCAEPSSATVDGPVNATFIPAREAKDDGGGSSGSARRGDSSPSSPDEVELHASDLDTYPYKGDEVDLEELLREQLVVAIPMTHLCTPGCKGLCTQCGANWNEGPCGCAAIVIAPPNPLAEALKNVKLK